MSHDFIGSKIAIITKSQCRYVGTIIGIDAQTSSIILGNAKCLGTENRSGQLPKGHSVGTTLPIVQFANNDIDDLKIVGEEQLSETSQQQSYAMSANTTLPSPPAQQSSIHDDPAIVSAVVSSSNKDNTSNLSISSRLINNLQHMMISDEKSKMLPKNEESRIRSNSGELGQSWSLLSPSKWSNNNHSKPLPSQQRSDNKSKFFDDFISNNNNNNNSNQFQSNRTYQRSSNTHSTQTSRENGDYNHEKYDDNDLPVRQPFFENDRPYPQRQQQQQRRYENGNIQQHQQRRYDNGNMQQHQQRYFYNNRHPQMPNQQRRGGGGGGNRETFQDNPNDYDNDFDFETSNLKFNKITNEGELQQETDLKPKQFIQSQIDFDSTAEHPILYDKKKSFFDNLAVTTASDGPTSNAYNRSTNRDTFGNDGYNRQNNRSNGGGGFRRPNNNYRRQQYDNDDFNYRQHNNNNNGYHYRY